MTDPTAPDTTPTFADLALSAEVLRVLNEVGYESPTPIQAATIPVMLAGSDVLGQAQTGTGKTAAFALPILSRLERATSAPQALVLAPTRELAIQVAEAFQRYATYIPGFHVLPIYGGQAYGPQLGGLKRGAHVVVGTPGRVIDHIERSSLDLSALRWLVLDEADEMLRMGFIDDVEKILSRTPATRQTALFSATLPAPIRRIAQNHMRTPVEVTIASRTRTATNIRQRYWVVGGFQKLDALTRILEAEPFEAMIVFARTKQATEELAEKLSARGFAAAAINGDIAQPVRERTIQRLKDGQVDILVATDVAARGLDVDRISHVLNYDIPYDSESYVHRIGRTGRAGRSGEAILFVTPRERSMLKVIERATRHPLEPMELPTVEAVNDKRVARFMQKISDTLAGGDLDSFRRIIETYQKNHDTPVVEIAAALARLVQGDQPLLLESRAPTPRYEPARPESGRAEYPRPGASRMSRDERVHSGAKTERASGGSTGSKPAHQPLAAPAATAPEDGPAWSRAHQDEGAPAPRVTRTRAEKPSAIPATDNPLLELRDDLRGIPAALPARPARKGGPEPGMRTFRVEVGRRHGVKPSNLVGAIANEANLDSKHIGRIEIEEEHSLVDLPEDLPNSILKELRKVWVSGRRLDIAVADSVPASSAPAARKPYKSAGAPYAGKSARPGKPPFKGKPPYKGKPPRG